MTKQIKYQDPNFDKEAYRKKRTQADAGSRRMERMINRADRVVGVHPSPNWPSKPVSKKARLKNTKRARKVQGV